MAIEFDEFVQIPELGSSEIPATSTIFYEGQFRRPSIIGTKRSKRPRFLTNIDCPLMKNQKKPKEKPSSGFDRFEAFWKTGVDEDLFSSWDVSSSI